MQDSITHEALEACTLADCPPGLFMFNGTMGFKSEYTTTLENPRRYQCDAYVVESGEYFHGGAKDTQERAALIVTPIRTGQLILAQPSGDEVEAVARKFSLGDRVTKTKGSSWTGFVVGFYSTSLTPIGYAVESENEPGSVQIYPESALEACLKARENGDG